MASKNSEPLCNFCGKTQSQVKRLLEGQDGIFICDDCVRLSAEILSEDGLMQAGGNSAATRPAPPAELPSPRQIVFHLDQYVIGQEQAKRVLAVAVYNHYKRVFGKTASGQATENLADDAADPVELTKSNVMLIGPTGSGKTLLAQTLAKLLQVPFTIADATTLTEAGYVGEDVESVLVGLLQNADWDAQRAAYGIIYIDEIDKIARKGGDNPSITRDVSGEGVQQALLKIIEGTTSNVPPNGGRKHPQTEYVQLDTRNILFICGGAFAHLSEVVKRRIQRRGAIGFNDGESGMVFQNAANQPRLLQDERLPDDPAERQRELRMRKVEKESREESELLTQVIPDDLLQFGLIPEFIGRLPVVVSLNALDRQTLKRILTEPRNSVVRQYKRLFAMDGVELEFEPETLDVIAREAFSRRTGARGLRSIVESALLDVMYEIPGRDDIARCVITPEVITHGKSPLLYNKQGQLVSIAPPLLKAA